MVHYNYSLVICLARYLFGMIILKNVHKCNVQRECHAYEYVHC